MIEWQAGEVGVPEKFLCIGLVAQSSNIWESRYKEKSGLWGWGQNQGGPR